MANSDDLVEWVKSQMEEREWSLSELARRSKVSKGSISELLSGVRIPGERVIVGLARGFGVDAGILLAKAGKMPAKPGDPDPTESELVALFRQLSEDQRDEKLAEFRLLVERGKKKGKRGAAKASPSGA